ncbi:MAG: hypothetical protein JWO53_377, partial [Chlamydiia bacterium]|nr:hypothetical protein [Chlamydiia bacterium]
MTIGNDKNVGVPDPFDSQKLLNEAKTGRIFEGVVDGHKGVKAYTGITKKFMEVLGKTTEIPLDNGEKIIVNKNSLEKFKNQVKENISKPGMEAFQIHLDRKIKEKEDEPCGAVQLGWIRFKMKLGVSIDEDQLKHIAVDLERKVSGKEDVKTIDWFRTMPLKNQLDLMKRMVDGEDELGAIIKESFEKLSLKDKNEQLKSALSFQNVKENLV